jgi:transposase
MSGSEVALRVGISVEEVSRIRRRFVEGGIEGLADQPKAGRKGHAAPPEGIERVVQTAMGPPPASRSRWTYPLGALRPDDRSCTRYL